MATQAQTLGPGKVNVVLTNIVKGHRMPGYSADELAPVVSVDGSEGKIRAFGKEFFNHYDTKRAPRTESKRLGVGASTLLPYVLTQNMIEVPLDDTEIEDGKEIDIKGRASKTATNAIQMDTEIELATLLQSTSTYASGLYTTLSSGSELNDVDIDPIEFLNGLKDSVRGKIATDPNTLWLSPDTEKAILAHPKVIARLGNADLKILTRDQLAKMLEFDKIIVPKSVYNNAGVLTDIYTQSAGMYYTAPDAERSSENPSFIYTLRIKGQTGPVISEYRDEKITSQIIRATLMQKFHISCQEAGYLILNTLST